jgi:hypothetical protein
LVRPEAKEEMDCSDDQPGLPLCVNDDDEKKKVLVAKYMPLPERVFTTARHMLASSGKSYPIRLSGSTTGVAFSSGVISLLALWSPLAIAEFTDFAVLFDQYRVVRHELSVWFNSNNDLTTAAALANVCLVGADPGLHISTATSTSVADLGEIKRWNPQSTRLSAASFVTGQKTLNRMTPANPLSKDGFLPVADAWSGQTVLFASAFGGSSTATGLAYQQTWDIEFRCRV